MNSINEKEKKLNLALEELKNLDLTNPVLENNIENLNLQKNQLEIEKNELEKNTKNYQIRTKFCQKDWMSLEVKKRLKKENK